MNKFELKRNKISNVVEEKINQSIKNYNINIESKDVEANLNKYADKTNLQIDIKEYYLHNKDNLKDKIIYDKKIVSSENQIVSDMNIKFIGFKKCIFKDIQFDNCNIEASYFNECVFENVIFNNCRFVSYDSNIVIFNQQCEFKDSIFKNCDLEESIFINSNLCGCRFILTNLKNAIISEVNIKNVHIRDCDMRGTKIIKSEIHRFTFEDDYLTKLDEDSFIDEMIINRRGVNNIESTFKLYRDISIKFEANRLPNKSGEYYFLYKKLESKTLKGLEKIKSYMYYMLCGYGEKPTYALITSMEIVLIFTVLYMFFGLSIGNEIIDYDLFVIVSLPLNGIISDFLRSLYFSVVTFTTVGYGDITPIGLSVFFSGVEMFLGVTMVGVWTATLARKITR